MASLGEGWNRLTGVSGVSRKAVRGGACRPVEPGAAAAEISLDARVAVRRGYVVADDYLGRCSGSGGADDPRAILGAGGLGCLGGRNTRVAAAGAAGGSRRKS